MGRKSSRPVIRARRGAPDALAAGHEEVPQSARRAAAVGGLTLYTIGYERTDVSRFLAALRAHEIATVIDVRELPLSRKSGFSKSALTDHLARSGVRYIHIAALGCPRVIRHRYRSDRDWARYERAFIEHLAMQQDSLVSIAHMTTTSKSALLCFEADATCCHRRIVAAAVTRITQSPVSHISIWNASVAGNAKGPKSRLSPVSALKR